MSDPFRCCGHITPPRFSRRENRDSITPDGRSIGKFNAPEHTHPHSLAWPVVGGWVGTVRTERTPRGPHMHVPISRMVRLVGKRIMGVAECNG